MIPGGERDGPVEPTSIEEELVVIVEGGIDDQVEQCPELGLAFGPACAARDAALAVIWRV